MATGRVPTTANSPLTAKGDLFGYSTTQARVPVGSDGDTLVADSAATTGLRWQPNFSAGKNKIINGDFGIWQRGTSFTSAGEYTSDRWNFDRGGSSVTPTVSRQTFTPGTAPVAGYEGSFFYRHAQATNGTSQLYNTIAYQKVEDVRTLAGQTVTLSAWIKADATRSLTFQINQNFGSGGSSTVVNVASSFNATTSWTRFTYTLTLGSLSGKTIGTNSSLDVVISSNVLNTAQTIEIWGVQVEAGSVATAFQTATGTLQGELAACQRYYWRTGGLSAYQQLGTAYTKSATEVNLIIPNPVPMRGIPTSVDSSTLGFQEYAGTIRTMSAVTLDGSSSPTASFIYATIAGSTAGYVGRVLVNNSTSGFLGFSAEL
jgi:hypothetical protein